MLEPPWTTHYGFAGTTLHKVIHAMRSFRSCFLNHPCFLGELLSTCITALVEVACQLEPETYPVVAQKPKIS